MAHSEKEIRAAIEECLHHCYSCESPVAKLAECVENLRAERWEPAEIHRIELSVLKLLAALLSDNGNDAAE
jgi:hypothetical protein